jgi:uncharacterized membrane protein
MKILKTVLTYLMAAFMVYGGVNHFLTPVMYEPFIPDFLPTELVNYGSGLLEIILGIGLLIPKFRYQAATGVFILMLIFLPLHVMDVFSEQPAIGNHDVALIRLPVQFLFIAWAWWISKPSNTQLKSS